MEENEFWGHSRVAKRAQEQNLFGHDDENDISNELVNADRATAPNKVLGGASTRQYASSKPTLVAPIVQSTPTPTPTANAIPRSIVPSAESTRAHRIQATSTSNSNETTSQASWLPIADEFSDLKLRNRSSSYEKDMEARCRDLLEDKKIRLDDIRDYDMKEALLRAALKMDIPAVLVPVMMFLENSLSRSLFYELIKKHRLATEKYLNMAKLRLENDYYIAMLKQFDRNEDVAMIRIRQASQTNDIGNKIAILDQAAIELSSHRWWHLQINEQRELLKKQREFQMTTANVRLENRTALETYKLLYETEFRRQKQLKTQDRSNNDRTSQLENLLHMSPEMIMCGKLSAIMHCGLHGHYDDFVHQAIHQGLFGRKYIIAPEYLADMVYNWIQYTGESDEKANERTAKFLNMIADPNRRLFYAEKFRNFDVAIDTIVNVLRDRILLETLRRRMPQNHPSYLRATSLLETSKWRN